MPDSNPGRCFVAPAAAPRVPAKRLNGCAIAGGLDSPSARSHASRPDGREGSMKTIFCVMIAVGSAAFMSTADARNVYVPGHYLANGTYVAPHYRQVPDA